MNLVARQNFGLQKAIGWNTFIGGFSASISSASLLATNLGISVGAISNFTVVGSDIKCRITGSYTIPISFSSGNSSITYYFDTENLITVIVESQFNNSPNLTALNLKGVTSIGRFAFRTTKISEFYFPNLTAVSSNAFDEMPTIPKTIYIPNCVSLGATSGDNGVFSASNINKIYTHPSLATNNGGAPDGDLTYAISRGAIVRYVTNLTAPNHITTLAVGTIYDTAIKVNFTTPSSTNAIDYYECYVNGVFKNNISASGGYVIGLTASTSYTITLVAVDIFYNKSLVSNAITQSTNAIASPFTGLVSYYKLDANSKDIYSGNNGIDTSVSYVAGKIGNAASFNGSGSKTIVGNPANLQLSQGTISCWIKTSGSNTSYRSIFGKIQAYNLFLVDNVLVVYNWGSFGGSGNKSTGINLNDGLWHHVALVFESGTALNYVYIDGVLRLTFSMSVLNQTDSFCIGSSNSSSYFNGLIDEASVYNTKLSQSQIDLIYNLGNGITL